MVAKHNINENAYKLTSDLAYIYGVVLGDGYTYKGDSINLMVKDKDFAFMFFRVLKRWSSVCPKLKRYYDKKVKKYYYTVSLYSTDAEKIISELTLNDIKLNSKFYSYFLKGLYDSEGCVDKSTKSIEFSMCNKKIVHLMIKMLNVLKIKTTPIRIQTPKNPKHKISYEFLIRKSYENYVRFAEIIGFCIKRKQQLILKKINWYKKRCVKNEKI